MYRFRNIAIIDFEWGHHADQQHDARRHCRPSQGELLNTQESARQRHLSRTVLLPRLAAGSRNAVPFHHTPLPVAGFGGTGRGPAEDDHRATGMLQHALPLLLERDAGVWKECHRNDDKSGVRRQVPSQDVPYDRIAVRRTPEPDATGRHYSYLSSSTM